MLSPPKLPASQVTPGAQKPIRPPGAAPCRWCCGCSPPRPGTGSATGSTTTCATPTSTGAITRHLLHLGGTITSTPRVLTVTIDPRPRTGSPARLPCLSRRSTQPRPACPATPGKSPTSSRRTLEFNNDQGPTSGGLSLGELIEHWNWRATRGEKQHHPVLNRIFDRGPAGEGEPDDAGLLSAIADHLPAPRLRCDDPRFTGAGTRGRGGGGPSWRAPRSRDRRGHPVQAALHLFL